jgi:hypothetical protein
LAKVWHQSARDSDIGCACLGYLGLCNANRNHLICAALPKVCEASAVTVAVVGIFVQKFANVKTALNQIFGIAFTKLLFTIIAKGWVLCCIVIKTS